MRRLKDEGRASEAGEVKSLRRPTVAAWALNRLSQASPEAIGELIDAGSELSRAQREILTGGSAAVLQEASSKRRALVARLSGEASAILEDAGRSPIQHAEEIEGTLEAASIDPQAGGRLRSGTLERSLRPPSGFGPGLTLVGTGAETEAGDAPDAGSRDPRERRLELEEDLRRLKQARQRAERTAATTERARARAEDRVRSLEERLEVAARELRQAEAVANEARVDAKRAAKEVDRLEGRLRDLGVG